MTDHVLASLVNRRATLAGEMHQLQGRLHQLHADIAALDAVIKQLDPEYRLDTIRPKYRRAPTPAETASISRAVLDALRRAEGPMTVKAIAAAIMAERGLDATDRAMVRSMGKRVDMALRYQRTNGLVVETDSRSGTGMVWEIAT